MRLPSPTTALRAASVRAKLVAALAATLLLTLGSFWWVLDQREGTRRQAEFSQRAAGTTQLLSRSLSYPLWNVDTQAIELLLDSVNASAEVASITVTAAGYGEVVPMRGGEAPEQDALERKESIHYTTADGLVRQIGEVRIVFSREPMRQALAQARLTHLGMSLAVLLGVFGVTYWLVGRIVRRPLATLDRTMRHFAEGDFAARCAVSSPDELGRVSAQFNTMAERLAASNEALRRHGEQLEERVRERTAELARAVDRAEVASRAKSAFLANMSHELRTPLNAVLGFAQLLRVSPPDAARLQRGLTAIERSGQHLLGLITDVLDLAKIEAGRMDLFPQAVELRRLLDDVMATVSIEAERKGLTLALDVPAALPAVAVDGQRLRQVLLNLLGNAIKFTPRGSVTLAVTSTQDAAAGMVQLGFAVRDTGIGIEEHDLDRLFRPFEQLGDAAYRSRGTGLGLALSRQLVRQMGGDIAVRSEPGRGSEFSFMLGLPITQPPPAAQAASRGIRGYAGRRRLVLVVDDIELNRQVLSETLSLFGFDVSTAVDGLDAVDQARMLSPDVVLMDLTMPRLSGSQAMQRLRSAPRTADIPVVAVSASAGAEEREAARRAGAASFIAKPVDQAELLAVLGQVLKLEWVYAAAVR